MQSISRRAADDGTALIANHSQPVLAGHAATGHDQCAAPDERIVSGPEANERAERERHHRHVLVGDLRRVEHKVPALAATNPSHWTYPARAWASLWSHWFGADVSTAREADRKSCRAARDGLRSGPICTAVAAIPVAKWTAKAIERPPIGLDKTAACLPTAKSNSNAPTAASAAILLGSIRSVSRLAGVKYCLFPTIAELSS